MKNSCVRTLYAIVLASSVCFLVGCETMPKVPAVPGDKKTVEFDRSLLQDCKELPKTKSASDTDLNDWAAAVTSAYSECAVNKRNLNTEVKKAFNIQ